MKKSLFIGLYIFLLIMLILMLKILFNNKDFRFKFKPYRSFLVPVQIGTEKFLFGLDTGATNNFIDTQLAQKFSTPLTDKNNKIEYHDALNSMASDTLIKQITFKLGKYDVLPTLLASHDLTNFRKEAKENIQGIIGLNIIRRFIWDIDIKNKQITMSENIKVKDILQCTKLQDDGYSLYIRTIYNKHNKNDIVEFKLDTGAMGNQIGEYTANYFRTHKSVQENILNKYNPDVVTTLKNKITVNDNINYIYNINLPIISNKKEYLEAIILENTDVFKDVDNLLGEKFINQFSKVIINPYEKTFCFIKNPEVKVLKYIRQIFIIYNDYNQIIIDYNNVKYLKKFGLKNKDIIVSMNGKKYDINDIKQVSDLLRSEHNLNLKIKRDDKIINVKLD